MAGIVGMSRDTFLHFEQNKVRLSVLYTPDTPEPVRTDSSCRQAESRTDVE